MPEHDEVYDDARADRLAEMLRALAERIRQLDKNGQLLGGVPELLRLMGDARSEDQGKGRQSRDPLHALGSFRRISMRRLLEASGSAGSLGWRSATPSIASTRLSSSPPRMSM